MSPADRVAHANRWRRKSLLEKSLLSFGMLGLAVALPPIPISLFVAVIMALSALIGARVPLRIWLGCLVAPVGFLLAGVVSVVFQWGEGGISLAPHGLSLAMGLAARSLAGVCCLIFLSLTTPASDLMTGLRRLGVPAELVEIALLMYRFVFMLAATAQAMDAAQAARLGHVGLRRRLHSLGLLIANLLPRAMDRARRLELGLAARGWSGDLRVLSPVVKPSAFGLSVILAAEAALLLLGLWERQA